MSIETSKGLGDWSPEYQKTSLDVLVQYGLRFHIDALAGSLILNYHKKPRNYFETAIPLYHSVGFIRPLYCGSVIDIDTSDASQERTNLYIHDQEQFFLNQDTDVKLLHEWQQRMQQQTMQRELEYWQREEGIVIQGILLSEEEKKNSPHNNYAVMIQRDSFIFWNSLQRNIPISKYSVEFLIVELNGEFNENAYPCLVYYCEDRDEYINMDLREYTVGKDRNKLEKSIYNDPARYRKKNPL